MILSVRGDMSIEAVFDSQVVRLDVSAPRVARLNVGVREWSGYMFFRTFLRLCGRVECLGRIACFFKNEWGFSASKIK